MTTKTLREYPLTPAQLGMLVHYLMLDEQGQREVYFDQHVSVLGPLDPAVLERAWRRLQARHEALRTSIDTDSETPRQIVHPVDSAEVPFLWQVHDWRDLSSEERERRLVEFEIADQQQAFDLAQASLSRVALFRFGENEWRQVWSFSHFVLDGWSMTLLVGELAEFYSAEIQGREPELEDAPPFSEFVEWFEGRDVAAAEEYWTRSLRGLDVPTAIPFDGSGGTSSEPELPWIVDEVKRFVPAAKFADVQALARRSEATVNTVIQAVWALLLSRSAGTSDVCLGVVSSGRPYEIEGVDAMVGMFVIALPMRVVLDESESVRALLGRLQSDQFEQRENEHVTWGELTTWAGVPRSTKVFESILVYENYPLDTVRDTAELDFQSVRLREAGGFAVTIFVTPLPTGFEFRLTYDWSRFGQREAERLLEILENGLLAAAANPFARLSDLSFVSEIEKREILALSQGAASESAAFVSIPSAVAARAAVAPDAIAVEAAGETLRYSELLAHAHQLAHRLVAHGIGAGDLVGICLGRTLDLPVALLAVLETGAAYVPLDPTLPSERLAYMVGDSSLRWVVAAHETLDLLPSGFAARVVDLTHERESLARESSEPLVRAIDPHQPAYAIYTSGSTGRPKGVLVPHGALAHYADEARRAFEITAADRVLQFASINFDTCVEEIYPCWLAGGTLVLRDEEMIDSVDGFVSECDRLGITVLDLPTAYWHEWTSEMEVSAVASAVPASLRLVILGGEAAHRDRWLSWRDKVGSRVRLINTYGPTEATVVSTRFDLTDLDESQTQSFDEPPIGRPIAGGSAFLLDAAGQLAPLGVDGEIALGGAGVALGYLGRPDWTAERFVPDPFSGSVGARLYRTGDLARWLPMLENSALEFRGRNDSQVKIRGHRIELGEVEQALRAISSVREVAVVAPLDDRGSRRLVAFVLPSDPAMPPVSDDLRATLSLRLSDAMIPAAFVTLDAIPRTPANKVDRRELERRALLAETFAAPSDAEPEAPRNDVERRLLEIWREVLRVERLGVTDSFFAVGGDSILAIQAASRSKRAGIVFTPRQLFEARTIERIAEVAIVTAGAQGIDSTGSIPTSKAPTAPKESAAFSHSGLDEDELASLLAELSK